MMNKIKSVLTQSVSKKIQTKTTEIRTVSYNQTESAASTSHGQTTGSSSSSGRSSGASKTAYEQWVEEKRRAIINLNSCQKL